MIDVLPISSYAKNPLVTVQVNGMPFTAWVEINVNNNRLAKADTFELDFAPSNLSGNFNLNYFFNNPLLVSIATSAGVLITGNADSFKLNPYKKTATINGRDLSALFMDNKTIEKFQNMTSSQIAVILANRRGLTPMVTTTTTRVGDYYQIDHARLTTQLTEWDLLTFLAREENFVVYVKGQTLYFAPKPSATQPPYVLDVNNNVTDLEFEQPKTIAKGIKVIVTSWNHKQKQGFTKTANAKGTLAKNYGDPQIYRVRLPNLTPAQAQQKANQLLAQYSEHLVSLQGDIAPDEILSTESVIKVINTGSPFDQIYYPDSVVRRFSSHGGYTMTVTAKDVPAETDTVG